MSGARDLSAKVKSATQAKKPANARILTCLEGQVNVEKGQVTAATAISTHLIGILREDGWS